MVNDKALSLRMVMHKEYGFGTRGLTLINFRR